MTEMFFLVLYSVGIGNYNTGGGHAGFVTMPEKYTKEQCEKAAMLPREIPVKALCVRAP